MKPGDDDDTIEVDRTNAEEGREIAWLQFSLLETKNNRCVEQLFQVDFWGLIDLGPWKIWPNFFTRTSNINFYPHNQLSPTLFVRVPCWRKHFAEIRKIWRQLLQSKHWLGTEGRLTCSLQFRTAGNESATRIDSVLSIAPEIFTSCPGLLRPFWITGISHIFNGRPVNCAVSRFKPVGCKPNPGDGVLPPPLQDHLSTALNVELCRPHIRHIHRGWIYISTTGLPLAPR